MGRPKRIRRMLCLEVGESNLWPETYTPGLRFAEGWRAFRINGHLTMPDFAGDQIKIAGFLAAKAAWDAHHHAVNWIELESKA